MTTTDRRPMQIVLITGMSGSGKSVALHALEDAGFYCVDNLPPELLESFIELERSHRASKVAIAMDVRSASSLPGLPRRLAALQSKGVHLTILFLDATTDTLIRRFSETRRRHPLALDHGLRCEQPDVGGQAPVCFEAQVVGGQAAGRAV